MFVLVMTLLMSSASPITVDDERLVLADVLPRAPAPWSEIDLGPTPNPGESMWLTGDSIRRCVAQAQLDPVPVQVPRRLRIVRSVQRVDEVQLRGMVEDALGEHVEAAAVRSVTVRGGIVMPKGPVSVNLDLPSRMRGGRQTIMAYLQSAHGRSVSFPVMLELRESRKRGAHVIQRGQSVIVRLRRGGILVEAPAVAQENGALQSVITVMPQGGSKVIHARVINQRYVEVEL
jgi:hypothetical protein